ncbi:MAG: enoyl-CoA hydratase/isomerase family protein [Oligoflexia bacterium]|nr:enoyl-CoA hydratase/isomerase family protein [Oligoflexia bacterium]
MEEETVKVAQDGALVEITINRPKSLNALNADVLQGLLLALQKVSKNPEARVVILTGAGEKAFVAGADIHGMAQLGPRPIADYVELGQRAMRAIETLALPVIAAVNGYALGGGLELALACDIIVASKAAKLGQPEVNLGIIPGFGGTQRLIQRCGVGAARRLVYTAELISAEEAHGLGLVDKLCEPADVLAVSRNMGQLIAAKAPLAVQGAKQVIRRSQDDSLLAGLRAEVDMFLSLFATADREEGMQAFMQKREPRFVAK